MKVQKRQAITLERKEREKNPMSQERSVQVICGDPILARRYLAELERSCDAKHIPVASRAIDARDVLHGGEPPVILLDESAVEVGGRGALETAVAMLTEAAPIVVVAGAERQSELAFLISSGAADFVARTGNFVPVAAGLVERRLRLADCAAGLGAEGEDDSEDFGEILRHEVNNPLTGILGNAELLLARREGLTPAAAARVETIAELAVRLRETVRRLSNSWVARQDHIGSR